MAQHDYVIDNGPGLAVRTDINAALAAIQSSNSGTVEPASKVPGQVWFNTTTGQLQMRNTGNTAWVPIGGLSTDGLTLFLKEGTTTRGSVASDGGASAGTTALRCFNSSGAQTGLFYVSSADIGTDRNTISVFNANDQALWFRAAGGQIRGGVYNYISGRTELRAYSGGVLKNIIGMDETGQGFTYGAVWQWNSQGVATDVSINHRVSGTRSSRFYFAQGGNIYLQQSDDNYGSHFINVFTYERGGNILAFSHRTRANGYLLNAAGSNGGILNGNGDGASFGTFNVSINSWWGIGFVSDTDGACRIVFDVRSGRMSAVETYMTGNMYMASGTRYQQDGNIIFTSGMTVYGGSLYDAIGTVWNGKAGVYTGSNQDETNFPVGHTLVATNSGATRNQTNGVFLRTSSAAQYVTSGSPTAGAQLAGTWRHRGQDADSWAQYQRVA